MFLSIVFEEKLEKYFNNVTMNLNYNINNNRMKTKSFTLIELLVVIVIIGILASVIILSVSSSIAKAQDAKLSSSILSLNKILKTNSVLSFPIEATPCNLKDSCTNLKSKIDIPKIEDDIYYVTSASGDIFELYVAGKSYPSLGFKITSGEESVFEVIIDSRDSNIYKTVKVGSQTWMAENLAYLPSVVGPATGSNTIPYQYVYGYNETDVTEAKATDNYKTYGVLYNWPAAVAACPAGWHLPSDEEFKILEMYVGMTKEEANGTAWRGTHSEGCQLREAGTTHWASSNGATNSSGFTGLGTGYRETDGSFRNRSVSTYLWSSTINWTSAYYRSLAYWHTAVYRGSSYSQDHGYSVRCIRDY